MKETLTDLRYTLPLGRRITIQRTERTADDDTVVQYTCSVQRGDRGIAQPGFYTIDACVRWAQGQLVEEESNG